MDGEGFELTMDLQDGYRFLVDFAEPGVPPLLLDEPEPLGDGDGVLDGVAHQLVAARLSAEFGIGVRHGCFCAHPYLVRVLGLGPEELRRFRSAARLHDRSSLPGAVRASAGISTTQSDLERLLEAVRLIASTPPPVAYAHDPQSGDYWPEVMVRPDHDIGPAAGCRRG